MKTQAAYRNKQITWPGRVPLLKQALRHGASGGGRLGRCVMACPRHSTGTCMSAAPATTHAQPHLHTPGLREPLPPHAATRRRRAEQLSDSARVACTSTPPSTGFSLPKRPQHHTKSKKEIREKPSNRPLPWDLAGNRGESTSAQAALAVQPHHSTAATSRACTPPVDTHAASRRNGVSADTEKRARGRLIPSWPWSTPLPCAPNPSVK